MSTYTGGPDKDTKVNSGQPSRNYGASTTVLGGTTDKALFHFDLSSIPAGAACNSATLKLYQAGSAAANAFTLTAYNIKSGNANWIEGTKNNATAGTGEPCWDYHQYNTVGWAGSAGLGTAGTDYDTTNIGTDTGNRSDANGTEYAIALNATAVAAWFGNAANYGILVLTSSGCGAIAAKEHATSGYRPVLEIDYTAGGTTYNQSIGGTVTPAGSLAKQTRTTKAGTVTPAGALTKRAAKILAGTVTPAGSLAKRIGKGLAGIVTPAGALTRQISKILAGIVTPAGTVAKRTAKALAGTVTPAGALAKIRTFLVSIGGTVTPAGSLSKRTNKRTSGTVTPTGGLTKRIGKALAGVVTAAGSLVATLPLGITVQKIAATIKARSIQAAVKFRKIQAKIKRRHIED